MSKQYDPQKLSSYINAAIGDCKKKDFAIKINISQAYLSRILNCKTVNPPSAECLRRIAAYASNGITYAQLLDAAGYAPIPEPPRLSTSDHTFFQGTILTALSALQIPFTKESSAEKEFDLAISFQQAPISHWYFRFLESSTESTAKQQMTTIYNSLVLLPFAPTDKISIVTSQTSEFDYYCRQIPNLDLNLSIILIDKKHLSVEKEQWIKTNGSLQKEDIKFFSL